MNEEQRKWLEARKSEIETALTANTAAAYEKAVDDMHAAIMEAPEP